MIRRADLDKNIQGEIARDEGSLPPRLAKLLAALLVRDVIETEESDEAEAQNPKTEMDRGGVH